MKMISIVTPVFNSEEYIENCILSIKGQTYQNFEHIIVDGGSTDKTIEIIKKYENTYNMKWLSEPDNGMYDAICKGFSLAKGEIFAWLNADDMYQPYALDIMNRAVIKKGIQWGTGFPIIYNETGIMYDMPFYFPVTFRWLMKMGYPSRGGCGLQQESTFWTKELWESADGNAIKKYKIAGDFFLWQKFAKKAELYHLNIIISGFRRHVGQKSEDREKYNAERGRWTLFNAILKVLHIPDIMIFAYDLIGGKKIIKYKDLF